MSRTLLPCGADLACYRTDGHDGEHAYANGRTPEPVWDTARLTAAVMEHARLVSQWADNVTEWEVPAPLNTELCDLRDALHALGEQP